MDAKLVSDIKEAYSFGLSARNNELSLSALMAEKGHPKERGITILNALVAKRAASKPRPILDGTDIAVKVRDMETVKKFENLSTDDYVCFCVVENSGTVGIQGREIPREYAKLIPNKTTSTQSCNKSLKILEDRGLIKQIQSIQGRNKKLYILSNIDPDKSVVGGFFYNNGRFDTELVERYRSQILLVVGTRGRASLNDIISYLKSNGMKEDLSDSDLKLLLKSLMLDQEIIAATHPTSGELFYMVSRWPDFEDFERLPCLSCPVQNICQREDLNFIDAILLRQNLTLADEKRKDAKSSEALFNSVSTDAAIASASVSVTTKVHPTSCPYFSQWLGLTFEPWVPKPAETPASSESTK